MTGRPVRIAIAVVPAAIAILVYCAAQALARLAGAVADSIFTWVDGQ